MCLRRNCWLCWGCERCCLAWGHGVAGVSGLTSSSWNLRGDGLSGTRVPALAFAGLPPLILSFSAISGLCKVHLSNLLSQGSNTQWAGSAFLGNNQKNFCAVFSIQSVMALAEDLTIAKKRFFLSAFSGMKYTLSIHVKHKSLIIFFKFWRCVSLPAINCRCEHNSKIKSRMQAY